MLGLWHFFDWLFPAKPIQPTVRELRHRALAAKGKWLRAQARHESSRGLYEAYRMARARQLEAELR